MSPRARLLVSLTLLAIVRTPLEGQVEVWSDGGRVEFSEFRIANVLPRGQPVVPVFEGWYRNPDGSKTASWGYFNMNTEETFDIPLGPDNFVEPAEYDGLQPTHFIPAPEDRGRQRRHESVFAVTVPPGFEGEVVWTLRVRGVTISSPSSLESDAYDMLDLESASSAPVAPALRIADGAPARGRLGPRAGPLTTRVGESITLDIAADLLGRERSLVSWYHHQGPGRVTFQQREFEVNAAGRTGEIELRTLATFSEPGDYVLRVTALESLSALVQHCCWTNGYLYVTVAP